MSEDNIPQKTLMSDAERKRLRCENETPEERAIRQEKQRERQRLLIYVNSQIRAWYSANLSAKYIRLPSERPMPSLESS